MISNKVFLDNYMDGDKELDDMMKIMLKYIYETETEWFLQNYSVIVDTYPEILI